MSLADVLLLSAGFGRRLRPLTEETPKPLLDLGGKPLLEHHLTALGQQGFCRAIVNAHYLAPKIERYLKSRSSAPVTEYVFEPVILDTGGAVSNIASRLWHDCLLIVNSDSVLDSSFSYQSFVQGHRISGAEISILVRKDGDAGAYGTMAYDANCYLTSFLDCFVSTASDTIQDGLMFAGISAWNRQVISAFPEAGSIFSLTRDMLCRLLNQGVKVRAVQFDGYWNDAGTPERLKEARNWYERAY